MASLASVNHNGIARYLQLATLFRSRIALGVWAVGGRIPNVADLATEFAVARGTIREAMDVLEGEGLVQRFRAKGSFVRTTPQDRGTHRLATDWESLISAHCAAETRVLEHASVTALPRYALRDCTALEYYEMMRRVHARDGTAFLVHRFYIDRALYRRVPHERFAQESTLPILHELAGSRIASATQVVTIGTADVDVAGLLNIPLNAPVVMVQRRAIDFGGHLLYLGEGTYRGDMLRMEMTLR